MCVLILNLIKDVWTFEQLCVVILNLIRDVCVEAGGSFFPTKAWCVFEEENGLSALKIVIGF